MKIKDMIANFDPKTSIKHEACFEQFVELFDLRYDYHSQLFCDVMVRHFVSSWICTDTRVGFSVYTMNDEIVAVSIQMGRKIPEDIKFISKEAAERVLNFTHSCCHTEEIEFDIVDLEEEIYEDNFNRGLKQ